MLQGVCATLPPRRAYCAVASRVRTVVKACKVAYPDMVGGGCTGQLQPLIARDRRVCRWVAASQSEEAGRPQPRCCLAN